MRTQVLDPGITAPAGVSVLYPHRHVAGCIGHECRGSYSQWPRNRDGPGRVGQRSPHRRVRALPCDGLHPKSAGKVPCARMTGCTGRCRGTCQPLTPRILLGRTGLSCCSCVVVHGLGITSHLPGQGGAIARNAIIILTRPHQPLSLSDSAGRFSWAGALTGSVPCSSPSGAGVPARFVSTPAHRPTINSRCRSM